MSKSWMLVLLLPALLSAQAPPVKSKALIACEAKSAALQKGGDDLLDGYTLALAEIDRLKAENESLRRQNADAIAILDVLDTETRGSQVDEWQRNRLHGADIKSRVFILGTSVEKNSAQLFQSISSLAQHDKEVVDKYNSLLADYKDYVTRVDVALNRQQRINNALALYGMMPRYTPPQTINLNVTDCTKAPMLCLH